LNRKNTIIIAAVLIVVISISLFFIVNPAATPASARQFYVGVEFAYGNQFSLLKELVDKVENYTNLFVIGSPSLTFNRTALDQSCDYLYCSKLNFIVQFTSVLMYNDSDGYPANNNLFDWIGNATQKYGRQFLGIYRFDEPGGNQLDSGSSQIIDQNNAIGGYSGVAKNYVGNLSTIVKYYQEHGGGVNVFTADYGLYWFDYASSYDAVFAELTGNQSRFSDSQFVGNESKQEIIALDRGAAESFHKNWGVIVTYEYNQPPYLESGIDLYGDLAQAYCDGATYAIVFSYPNITINGVVNPYGILTEDHFGNMSKFWNDIHNDTITFTPSPAEAAYVLPNDYGFGFRSPTDSIWGLFPPDAYTSKIWCDTQFLIANYSYNLNIIYADPQVVNAQTLRSYKAVYYYNQTVT
jgi:hypothetical protein